MGIHGRPGGDPDEFLNGIKGVTDGSVAGAGEVGEIVEEGVSQDTSLTSGVPFSIFSQTLQAGEWEIHGNSTLYGTASGFAAHVIDLRLAGTLRKEQSVTTGPDANANSSLAITDYFRITTPTLVEVRVRAFFTGSPGTFGIIGTAGLRRSIAYARRIR